MSKQDELIARLEELLERAGGGPVINPTAATVTGGWPAPVVSGELIESAWGNAVVDSVAHVHLSGNYNIVTPIAVTLGPGPVTVLDVTIPSVLTYDTRMVVSGWYQVGATGSIVDGIRGEIDTDILGALSLTNPTSSSTGGSYGGGAVTAGWNVPAGGSPDFSIGVTWTAGTTGTVYAAAAATWDRYRV